MSTLSTATQNHGATARSVVRKLPATIGGLWVSFIRWRVQRAAVRHLMSMTDSELADIGLLRSQIEEAVMVTARKSVAR